MQTPRSQGEQTLTDYHNKLSHLAAEDIETLYQRYLAGEPIATLLVEYAVDVPASGLIRAFPPVPCTDLNCPWCERPLHTRRRGKSQPARSVNEAFCLTCEHRYYFPAYNRLQRYCICAPCSQERDHARHDQQTRLREQILAHWAVGSESMVPYATLGIGSKLTLMAIIEARGSVWSDRIEPVEPGHCALLLSPSDTMDATLFETARLQNLLLIDPHSPLEAFVPNPAVPRLGRVHWICNITLDGQQRATFTELYRHLHRDLSCGPRPEWHRELTQLIRSLAVEEIYGQLERRCAERGLAFRARERSQAVAESLLEHLSVCHIWDLANTALRSTLQFAEHCNVNSAYVVSTLPGKLNHLGHRAIGEHWPPRGSRQAAGTQRSVYSRLLHGLLLGNPDGGLEYPLKRYAQTLPCAADTSRAGPSALVPCPRSGTA